MAAVIGALLLAAGAVAVRKICCDGESVTAAAVDLRQVVPAPASVRPAPGVTFTLTGDTAIQAPDGATRVADQLAALLRPPTGFALPVQPPAGDGGIALVLSTVEPDVGEQGYRLDVTARSVTIRARTPAGLFAGVQTLRQLLPPEVESRTVHPGPWVLPGGSIVDRPRYPYRGAMLDVARHFFGVDDVLRYLDYLALYKINYLHLHLSDDQGWRIAIDGWPRLASHGGRTEVGGGPGGFYTKDDYRRIVAYAEQRYITVVPEIDMPGHTNAALSSYGELSCDGKAPAPYTGTRVGFSSLCPTKEVTYDFVADVLGELAALTPGRYLHVGGDEAMSTSEADYVTFMNRVQGVVAGTGKTVIGWHQLADAEPADGRILQYWTPARAPADAFDTTFRAAVKEGAKVVLSPADHAYLDMKYSPSSPLGLTWAGTVEVEDAYGWDPDNLLPGLDPAAVLGVEAPLWTETVTTMDEVEYLAFPRLTAIAELGWAPKSSHDWATFRIRLGNQRPRWTALGIDFYDSPQLP